MTGKDKPELARGDNSRELHEAQVYTEKNLERFPETKQEQWRREYEGDKYG